MDEVDEAKGLRDMIFPVLWFESGIDGIDDPHTLELLQTAIYMPEKAKQAMIPTFFCGWFSFGFSCCRLSGLHLLLQTKKPNTTSNHSNLRAQIEGRGK